LNREGRLEDFNARREQLRATLREQGMRRKEAADQAWRQALAEFPPLASDPGSDPGSVEDGSVRRELSHRGARG
jgi:hypothetical protein